MPYRPFESQNCSVARALSVIGERWTLLVMREVLLGHRRFTEIKQNTGIATNILSDRLQTLVDHGVLERMPARDGSEAMEYVPTEKGRDVSPVMNTLMHWGDKYMAPDGPPRISVHAACGHDADPHLVCSHCGEVMEPRTMQLRPGPGASEKQRAEPVLPSA